MKKIRIVLEAEMFSDFTEQGIRDIFKRGYGNGWFESLKVSGIYDLSKLKKEEQKNE